MFHEFCHCRVVVAKRWPFIIANFEVNFRKYYSHKRKIVRKSWQFVVAPAHAILVHEDTVLAFSFDS